MIITMHLWKKGLFLNIVCILVTGKVCSTDSAQFTAAVVEYYPVPDTNLEPEARLLQNVNEYIRLLETVTKALDIVVFPESVLHSNARIRSRSDVLFYSTELPDQFNGTSACNSDQYPSFLIKLACTARTFHTYLVANVIEKAVCSEKSQVEAGDTRKCSDDGWNLHNTNVVFNREGAIIAKYRKYNLFGEYYFNQTLNPDVSTFKTDFGVTFGLFTCFDILFRRPAAEMVKEYGITHFIFPSKWYSELPFLTALQAQQQWAQEHNAVFLASGANNPRVGSGGTGIYQGNLGPLVFDLIHKAGSNIYVASIPTATSAIAAFTEEMRANTDVSAKELDGFYLLQDDLREYTTKILTSTQQPVEETICSGEGDNQLCCQFVILADWNNDILGDGKNHYQYHMVAYSGIRTFSGVYNGGVEVCGVVACQNEQLESCGKRFKDYDTISWPITFKEISIKANFTVENNRVQHPNSVLSNLRPLPVSATEWSYVRFADKSVIERSHKLVHPQNRLMTFAIYGRDFNRDSDPLAKDDDNNESSGSESQLVKTSLNFIFLMILLQIIM